VGHGAVFCGDTLFSGGCGRLFEGSPAQMLRSLDRLAALPAETLVYCAHEYTAANLSFAATVEPDNEELRRYRDAVSQRRAAGAATIPSTIGLEQTVNPFLRSRTAAVRRALERHLGQAPVADADAFAALREWKNGFRA
jgi:hydroxyacylglutathione hydrolase